MAYAIDSWVKAAQIAQGFSTPVIAALAAVITFRIQRRQANTQEHQAKTQHLQHRLALMERRMKIFNATLDFILPVVRDANIEIWEPLFQLRRNTREHHLLFGPEIGEYLEELFKKGSRLLTINQMSGPQHIIRPEDIPVQVEIVEWFSVQIRVAEQKFLKYIDFREP
jgi:hypothetical protein